MTSAADQTVELNDAARKLQAPKRRIYDVTNVLEGKNNVVRRRQQLSSLKKIKALLVSKNLFSMKV